MITTKGNFSPSVNIQRDCNRSLNYIATSNGRATFNNILSQINKGVRSFNIVGAYGSGKSAFLLAFERCINGMENYFGELQGPYKKVKYESINLVGQFDSIISSFARSIGLKDKSNVRVTDILAKVNILIENLQQESKGLIIFIDEFGKHLEYAAKNEPEIELYFLQQLAEIANDPSKNVILIATLHQDFNAYSSKLSRVQRNEWSKVKGRFCEIPFNEPVEQLLYLASRKIPHFVRKAEPPKLSALLKVISESRCFPLRHILDKKMAASLYPLDVLSASVLTLALQQYGQNERSLFSFLEYEYLYSIHQHNYDDNPYYNLSCVYDYLNYNLSSFINSKDNPHYSGWFAIKQALERIEGQFHTDFYDAQKVIKAIGLLNIFGPLSAKLDSKFLEKYGEITLGVDRMNTLVRKLERSKIIRFSSYSNKYKLFESTDLNIELAINEAGRLVERVSNLVDYLRQYVDLQQISAKGVFIEQGTPRVFEFKFSEKPLLGLIPQNEIDGFINLIFSETLADEDIRKASADTQEAVIYGMYRNTGEIKDLITDIERVKKVINDNLDDRVAKRELEIILAHQKNLLNHYVKENLFSEQSTITWFYKGKQVLLNSKKDFNKFLSKVCKDVYSATPVFHNELINKTKLSGQIITAKRSLIDALINHSSKEDLGFPPEKFPPEKTIYLSLLKSTGIHRTTKGQFYLDTPTEKSFQQLWLECERFFNAAKHTKKNVRELVEVLGTRPFKLKKGFIDFWIPLLLIIKRQEFALFQEDTFIPELSVDLFDSITKNPNNFFIKTFEIGGIKLKILNKYRTILQQGINQEVTKDTFVETIRPFLVFYRNLPAYSKQTMRLSNKALALRDAIARSKDIEKVFFEDFLEALGYGLNVLKKDTRIIDDYIDDLQNAIREIRTSFPELLNRIENSISEILFNQSLNFAELRRQIIQRYRSLKTILLLPEQRSFYNRLVLTEIDRAAWLNSVCNVLLNKPLENISDNDEFVLYEKLSEIFMQLDNLCEVNKLNIDNKKENAIKIDITPVNGSPLSSILRYPLNKRDKIDLLSSEISKILTQDKQLNQAALVTLLKKELK